MIHQKKGHIHKGEGLVYWVLMPQQQPGSYQGGEMMMIKSVFWWRKPEYPEETTDLRQVTGNGEGAALVRSFMQIIYICGFTM